MGLFIWIREGVRRAVVLGFSDAVAEIGERHDGEDLGEQLANTLRQRVTVEPSLNMRPRRSPLPPAASARQIARADPQRKRLTVRPVQPRRSQTSRPLLLAASIRRHDPFSPHYRRLLAAGGIAI